MVGVGGIKAYFAFSIAIWLALCQYSSQISLPTDPTYNAGVVEFAAAAGSSSSEILKLNVRSMVSIIESEATKDLDILVFPEYVLNKKDWRTYVPDPELLIAPCDVPDYHQSLVDLSCAARSRKLYVVVNVAEKYKCAAAELESCNANGLHGYNTNVVFDRMGRVISRYRKTHLYGSEWYSSEVLSQPERAVFTTDFGVTFGHFICFDMLFYDPAEVLTQQMNVTDIIYPTYWFSELPFLTALQLQEGWAYANNVNLLAAGGSYPAGKNTGSGIFAGRHGRLAAAIFEEPTTKLLTAKVPKRGFNYELPPQTLPIFEPQVESQRFTKLSLLRDYNVDIFATILLPQNFTSVTEKLCHNDFCCDFQVQRTLIQESSRHTAYSYRLAAYSGNQTTFQRKDQSDLSICAIVACTNDQLYSCGHIFPESVLVGNKYYFNSISISGGFRPAARRLIAPSTVDATMMPLPVAAWSMNEVERANVTEVTIKLNAPQEDLLTFGLWANYYSTVKNTHNLDRTSANIRIPTNNAAASLATGFRQHHVMILLSLCLLLTVFKFKF